MQQVIIDKEKCTGCGVCATICPYRAIDVLHGGAEYILEDCFLCGQCEAVCPEDAVRLPALAENLELVTIEENKTSIPPGTTDPSGLVSLMQSRRSCRKYLNKAVDVAMLEDLVKIGTTAPSGTNSQSWGFIVLPAIEDLHVLGGMVADYYRKLNQLSENPFLRFVMKMIGRDSLEQYYHRYHDSVADALHEWDEKGTDRLFHGAVAAILVTGKKDASCPAEDALLATQNILLAAHTMGLGSCLIGFVVEAMRREPKIGRRLGVTGGEEIYSTIALGYPAVNYLRPAKRKHVVPQILKLT